MGGDPSELGERIHRGDRAAEAELAAIYYERVLWMMMARTRNGDDALDLTHDALLVALVALRNGRLRRGNRLEAFVHGTARNIVNTYLRMQRRRRKEAPLLEDLPAPEVGTPVEDVEETALVRQAIRKLEPIDGAILWMTLVEQKSPREIAAGLSLTPDRVRSRKSRGIRKLVNMLRGRRPALLARPVD